METDYQFHGAEARGQVARVLRAAFDNIFTDLSAKGAQPGNVELFDVRWGVYAVENHVHHQKLGKQRYDFILGKPCFRRICVNFVLVKTI